MSPLARCLEALTFFVLADSLAPPVSRSPTKLVQDHQELMHDATGRLGRCFSSTDVTPGSGAMQVRSVKQRFGHGHFLVARDEKLPRLTAQAAMTATYETLLNNCSQGKGRTWLADVSPGDDEVIPLAASLGCPVAAYDLNDKHTRSLNVTRCINEPKMPFLIFPGAPVLPQDVESDAAAGTVPKSLRTNLDEFFTGIPDAQFVASGQHPTPVLTVRTRTSLEGHVALLRVTPHGCCGGVLALRALQGAQHLLEGGRVQSIAVEMNFDEQSTEGLLGIFHDLEKYGYQLLHLGPHDSPRLDITDKGSYPLFRTDTQQLREIYERLLEIRRFDERTGTRVHGDGLSLDVDGRYFDYTNLVVALKEVPALLTVRPKATIRFDSGTWWPEETASK